MIYPVILCVSKLRVVVDDHWEGNGAVISPKSEKNANYSKIEYFFPKIWNLVS